MKSGNSVMVRKINREVIRDTLKALDNANLAEIARHSGLSTATCANIVPELVRSGEAVILEQRQSQGGRPARIYAYNPDHTLVASVLLRHVDGMAGIRYAVRNTAGKTVSEGHEEPAAFSLERLDALVARLAETHPALGAAAVSVPGVVYDGHVEQCDIPELADTALETRLRDRHGLEAVIENDMNFAAAGYWITNPETVGAGLAYMSLPADKCPGCGIIVNGSLVKGKSNFAGELAYIPFEDGGRSPPQNGRTLVEKAARLCCALTAVVNPDVVVLSGDGLRPDTGEAVRARCLEVIPERHLPRLLVRDDYEDDCLAGMLAMAEGAMSCGIRIVERNRAWCAD